MKITVETLRKASACPSGVAEFAKHFPDGFEGEWTPAAQAGLLLTDLRKYLGWAYTVGLIPIWTFAKWNLSSANLSSANLSSADLRGANLRGADLSNAVLYGADLSNANLSSADLRGANLYGANLYGAVLYGADLSNAVLYGAIGVAETADVASQTPDPPQS